MFIDPLKAFDIINHSLLLTNPNAYSFSFIAIKFGKCKK